MQTDSIIRWWGSTLKSWNLGNLPCFCCYSNTQVCVYASVYIFLYHRTILGNNEPNSSQDVPMNLKNRRSLEQTKILHYYKNNKTELISFFLQQNSLPFLCLMWVRDHKLTKYCTRQALQCPLTVLCFNKLILSYYFKSEQ